MYKHLRVMMLFAFRILLNRANIVKHCRAVLKDFLVKASSGESRLISMRTEYKAAIVNRTCSCQIPYYFVCVFSKEPWPTPSWPSARRSTALLLSVPCEFKMQLNLCNAKRLESQKPHHRFQFSSRDRMVNKGSPDHIVFDHHLTPRTPRKTLRNIMKKPRSN